MTIGLYMQELVRRVDPAHRTLGRFFREEVAAPLGLDFFIGLAARGPGRATCDRAAFLDGPRAPRRADDTARDAPPGALAVVAAA
jgi:hypothetical protein